VKPYCWLCRSYFCPHVQPEMYRDDGLVQATEEWVAAARRYAEKKRRLQDRARREHRDRHLAVRFYWWHLRQRQRAEHDPVDVLDDGRLATFLTVGYVQDGLRRIRVKPNGEHYAARIIRLLCEMGYLADTGLVKKPRARKQELARRERFSPPAPKADGGQGAQPGLLRSYWWRVFALPRLGRLRISAFGSWIVGGLARGRKQEASLSALLRRQDLVRNPPRRSRPHPGSVQWAFAATGPP
jgi:hypothetical protein